VIHHFTEDVAFRRLEFIGRRTWGAAIFQAVLTLGIVGFLAVYFLGVAANLVEKLPDDWFTRPDCWGRLVLAMLIFYVPAAAIGLAFIRVGGAISDGWQRLTWDGRAGELVAIERGGLLGRCTQTIVPLREITRLDLHATPAGRNLSLLLTVHCSRGKSNRQSLEMKLVVEHVDRREEALDLLFRIGRMCDLGWYAVPSSDLRNLRVRLVRDPHKSTRYQPLPAPAAAADYRDNTAPLAAGAPAIQIARFRPESFHLATDGALLAQWQPGQRIHLHTPGADAKLYAFAAGIGAATGGFAAYNLAEFATEWLPVWGSTALAILLGAAVACLWVYCRHPGRDVIFDWLSGRVSWRVGPWRQSASLASVQSLLLRGSTRTSKQKQRRSQTWYYANLEMLIGGRRVFVVQSPDSLEEADTPAKQLGPFTAALADALQVGWKWQDYSC
jgi:hypothetical protein